MFTAIHAATAALSKHTTAKLDIVWKGFNEMDAKKLNKWADLLLDTGKRNNLINFSDRRATTAEVLLPSADVLFEKIDGATAFDVFNPEIMEGEDELDLP